ncbi:MAG: hypothetical protein K2H75_08965 [Muribaculaceae bacterium]|nr:hypothetical protein [Muribaculaceae bacterium]
MQKHLLTGFIALTVVSTAVAAPTLETAKATMLNFIKSITPHSVEGKTVSPFIGVRSGFTAPQREVTDNTPIWRAGTREVFYWEDEWIPIEKYNDTYTDKGFVEIEDCTDLTDGSMSRESNTYNANGMLSRRLTQFGEEGVSELENSQLVERSYDERLTDVIVENNNWFWIDGEWSQIGNNYRRIIERNEAGNITSVVLATLYMGEFDPSQRLTVTYGDNGEAVSMVEELLTYDDSGQLVWEVAESLENIVWETTNGQLYDIEEIYDGANRIKSGIMNMEGIEVDFNVEYMEAGQGYTVTMSTSFDEMFQLTVTGKVEYLDASGYGKGSYRTTATTTITLSDEILDEEIVTECIIYDDYGIELLVESTWTYGGVTEVEERMVNSVSYDPEYGYPVVAEASIYDPEAEEMYLYMKCIYSDYTNVAEQTEINTLPASSVNDVEYFTLQGIRVDKNNLEPGVYIRRQGNEARKVVVP